MTETIVVLDAISHTVAERLRALLPDGFELTHGTALGDEHLAEIIAGADYAISGQVAVSGAVLRAAKRLKLLHKWGVGVDKPRHRGRAQARDQGRTHHRQQLGGGGGVHDRTDDLRVAAHPARPLRPAERTMAELARTESVPALGQDGGTGGLRLNRQGRRAAAVRIRMRRPVQQAAPAYRRRGEGAPCRIRGAAGAARPVRRGIAALPADSDHERAHRPRGAHLDENYRSPDQCRARWRSGGARPRVGVAEPGHSRRRGRRVRDRAAACRQPPACTSTTSPSPRTWARWPPTRSPPPSSACSRTSLACLAGSPSPRSTR